MSFDDLFGPEDFQLIPDEVDEVSTHEDWDTGSNPDIFASGETPDIFSTK